MWMQITKTSTTLNLNSATDLKYLDIDTEIIPRQKPKTQGNITKK